MESRKIRDNQIKVTTFSTGINMKARNARLNSNGGWCVKTIENYVYKKKKYHLPSEFLGKCTWLCCSVPSSASLSVDTLYFPDKFNYISK